MAEDPSLRAVESPPQANRAGISARTRVARYSAIDLMIAGSAVLISCVSLFIAVQQSTIMEKTLAAGSWPLLQFASGNTNDQGQLSITLAVENQGVGPAIIRHFRIVYGGKEYENFYELMRDCCDYVIAQATPTRMGAGTPLTQPVEGKVVKGGDKIDFFMMDLAAANANSWRKLDAARFKFKFDACYCSVLGDCWQSDLSTLDQKKVPECPLPLAKG